MALKIPNPDILAKAIPEASNLGTPMRGGQKIVFRAKIGNKEEALKLFQVPIFEGDQADVDAFRKEVVARVNREIDLLGKCKSAFIVKLGTLKPRLQNIDDQEYIVYSEEFLEGDNLWNILRSSGRPKPDEAELKILMACLLKAVNELWFLKTIHRDIKPQNVLKLNRRERPFVLLDLGIAFSVIDTPVTVNTAGFPPATYRYIAPEMLDPNFRKNIDFRADLYTIGLTVFEYAAQKHPIARDFDDQFTTISRALSEMPPSLHQFRPDLSEEFCSLIDQLLKKTPALRPSNLDQIIKKIEGR